jgi:hypothetical protein
MNFREYPTDHPFGIFFVDITFVFTESTGSSSNFLFLPKGDIPYRAIPGLVNQSVRQQVHRRC